MLPSAISFIGIIIRNIISTSDPWLFYAGVSAISFMFVLIYLATVDMVDWVLKSKTLFWNSLLEKGRSLQNPARLQSLVNKGVYSHVTNYAANELVLIKIVLKVEFGHATSFVNIYATP